MKSRVRIGYQVEFPPFMYEQEGPRGLVIEALGPALESLEGRGHEVEWVPLALEQQEQELLSGAVDLLAGLGVTSARTEAGIEFGPPLVRTGGALFPRAGLGHPARRIVTPTSGPLGEPTRRAFPDCEVLDAVDYPDALAQVVAGTADAAALNLHVGSELAERAHPGGFELPVEPFAVIELASAFRAGSGELRARMDAG